MDLERETSQIQQINRYNNPNRAYERGITPEKNILIKNIITPSPFAKNISLVSENNKIYFEQSRHGRQLSYHTPCYTRSGYSQFQTNNTVINAVKFVKY